MLTTLSTYLSISGNLAKWQGIAAKSPAVSQQTSYYVSNIGRAKSIDGLLENSRLYRYAMTAFGLSDRIDAKALIRKVLQQGVASPSSLANKLSDPRIKAFATAFDFSTYGEETTSRAEVRQDVVNLYMQQQLESDQGRKNPGVQLALYFRRQAPTVTSVYGILADKNLLTVVQTALGVSPMTSAQNIDVQARLLGGKLKVADFQDPKKLESFIARFTAMYDSNASATRQSGSPLAFGDDGSAYQAIGVSAQLLLSLQNIRIAR